MNGAQQVEGPAFILGGGPCLGLLPTDLTAVSRPHLPSVREGPRGGLGNQHMLWPLLKGECPVSHAPKAEAMLQRQL